MAFSCVRHWYKCSGVLPPVAGVTNGQVTMADEGSHGFGPASIGGGDAQWYLRWDPVNGNSMVDSPEVPNAVRMALGFDSGETYVTADGVAYNENPQQPQNKLQGLWRLPEGQDYAIVVAARARLEPNNVEGGTINLDLSHIDNSDPDPDNAQGIITYTRPSIASHTEVNYRTDGNCYLTQRDPEYDYIFMHVRRGNKLEHYYGWISQDGQDVEFARTPQATTANEIPQAFIDNTQGRAAIQISHLSSCYDTTPWDRPPEGSYGTPGCSAVFPGLVCYDLEDGVADFEQPQDYYGILMAHFEFGAPLEADLIASIKWHLEQWRAGTKEIYPGWAFLSQEDGVDEMANLKYSTAFSSRPALPLNGLERIGLSQDINRDGTGVWNDFGINVQDIADFIAQAGGTYTAEITMDARLNIGTIGGTARDVYMNDPNNACYCTFGNNAEGQTRFYRNGARTGDQVANAGDMEFVVEPLNSTYANNTCAVLNEVVVGTAATSMVLGTNFHVYQWNGQQLNTQGIDTTANSVFNFAYFRCQPTVTVGALGFTFDTINAMKIDARYNNIKTDPGSVTQANALTFQLQAANINQVLSFSALRVPAMSAISNDMAAIRLEGLGAADGLCWEGAAATSNNDGHVRLYAKADGVYVSVDGVETGPLT